MTGANHQDGSRRLAGVGADMAGADLADAALVTVDAAPARVDADAELAE